MNNQFIFDHTVTLVRDIDHAAATYRRLGFHVLPQSKHNDFVGTANHVMVTKNSYLEIMGVLTPTVVNEQFRTRLDSGEGLWLAAFSTDNAAATSKRLQGAGLAAPDPVHGSRFMQDPDGNPAEAPFNVTFLPMTAAHGTGFFFCEHLKPELTYDSRYHNHPNGVIAMQSVTTLSESPASLADLFGRILAPERVSVRDGQLELKLDNLMISILDRSAAASRYQALGSDVLPGTARGAGITLQVADLKRTREVLDRGKVAYVDSKDRLMVHPRDACGVVIEYVV